MTNYEGPPQWPHGGKFELAPGGGDFGDVYDGLGRVLGCRGFYIYQYFHHFSDAPFRPVHSSTLTVVLLPSHIFKS